MAVQSAPLPVLWNRKGVSESEEGHYIAEVGKIARAMRKTGWASDGDPVGITEGVNVDQLWYLPQVSLDYAQEEIAAMGDSLMEMRNKTKYPNGQITLITVMQCRDPRPEAHGGTGGMWLILDGKKRYRAMIKRGIKKCFIDAAEYYGFYDFAMQVAVQKLSQHDLTYLEIGRLVNRLRSAWELEQAAGSENLEEFPTQERMAKRLGRSQATLSRCSQLDLSPELATQVERGVISQSQATEILPLPKEQQTAMVETIAQQQATQGPMTRDEVRGAVRDQQGQNAALKLTPEPKPPRVLSWPQINASAQVIPLRLPGFTASHAIEEQPIPVLIANYAYDLRQLMQVAIDDILAQGQKPDPALQTLLKALAAPVIASFVGQVIPPED